MPFLIDAYAPVSARARDDLARIEALVTGDVMLSGLWHPTGVPRQHGIADMDAAFHMMVDQSVWDLPQPWPYQYFPGIIEEETGRLRDQSGLDPDFVYETLTRHNTRRDAMTAWHLERIADRLRATGTGAALVALLRGRTAQWLVFNQLPNELDAQLHFLATAAALGGIDASPVASAYLKRLEAGTMACAWVGPPRDEGGDVESCLRHLAPERA